MSLDDKTLREAFAGLEGGGEPPVDPERIWAAAAGELSPDETAALVDRMASDPDLAAEWRLARALGAAPAEVRGGGRWRTWGVGLALAAGVLLSVRALDTPGPGDTSEFRDGDTVALVSDLPEGATLDRAACTLRWSGAPEGSRYSLRISTQDLTLLDRPAGLTTPSYTVPADKLEGLAAGDRLLWQVEAALPDGVQARSATFVNVLR